MINTPASLRSDLITISPESVITISGIRRDGLIAVFFDKVRPEKMDLGLVEGKPDEQRGNLWEGFRSDRSYFCPSNPLKNLGLP